MSADQLKCSTHARALTLFSSDHERVRETLIIKSLTLPGDSDQTLNQESIKKLQLSFKSYKIVIEGISNQSNQLLKIRVKKLQFCFVRFCYIKKKNGSKTHFAGIRFVINSEFTLSLVSADRLNYTTHARALTLYSYNRCYRWVIIDIVIFRKPKSANYTV